LPIWQGTNRGRLLQFCRFLMHSSFYRMLFNATSERDIERV
jgi:hypothetical protein